MPTLHPADYAVSEYDEAVTGHSADDPGTPPLAVVVTEPVRTEPEAARTFTTGTAQLTTMAARVVNDVPTRVRLVVTAIGGTATIARSQALCGPTTGYQLAAGQSLTINARGELWAADVANTGNVSLSYLIEQTA